MRSLAPLFTPGTICCAEIDQRSKGLLLLPMWYTSSNVNSHEKAVEV